MKNMFNPLSMHHMKNGVKQHEIAFYRKEILGTRSQCQRPAQDIVATFDTYGVAIKRVPFNINTNTTAPINDFGLIWESIFLNLPERIINYQVLH